MKKIKLSIKYRIFLLYTFSMIGILLLSLFLTRFISSNVLEKTLSEYLISAVNSNTSKLYYQIEQQDNNFLISIKYNDGYILLDRDFLSILNDVESGLYKSDGSLLYGGDKVLSKITQHKFTYSRIYKITIGGKKYIVYDRKVNKKNLDDLWIRGIVPLTNNTKQLNKINQQMLSFLPLFALIIIIGSIIASYSILKPIRKMKKTASEILDGEDLNKRIPTYGNKDEIDDLAISYNKMFDRLEESFNREKQFTSDASHELRTPLSVILNQTEYTLDKEDLNDEQRESIQVIDRQSKRMKKLIEDMLGLSRLASGSDKYPRKDLDLSKLLKETCMDMALISYNNIKIETSINEYIHINGNEQLLERMIINLIDNAYKYGKANGKTKVTLTDTSNEIKLTVEDNGIGIDKENLKHIFDRFYRESSSRSDVNGYGLGLSLVSEIVKYHNGRIDVESEKGVSTTFILTFKK